MKPFGWKKKKLGERLCRLEWHTYTHMMELLEYTYMQAKDIEMMMIMSDWEAC